MLRRILRRIPPFSWLRNWLFKHCLLHPPYRAVSILNFIVQRIVGYNRSLPWPLHFTSSVTSPGNIKIGKNCDMSFMISGHCYYQAENGIEIGDDTIWAPGVQMISANHDSMNLNQHILAEPIRIGRNCWIGANAVILPSVQLGDRVVVGAGAIVTKSFPSDSVIVGNPARIIKRKEKI